MVDRLDADKRGGGVWFAQRQSTELITDPLTAEHVADKWKMDLERRHAYFRIRQVGTVTN